MVDWNKQDRFQMRNFNESVDHHDICKIILMRLLRRKHTNRNKCLIYSEKEDGDNVWDIWVRTENGDIYCYELQKNYSKAWELKLTEDNPDVDVVVIKLKKLPKDSIKKITEALKKYVY